MSDTPTLRAGAKGTAVLAAQTRLRMHGAKIEADSSFGPATTKAVKTFQKAKGLTADGVIGAKTWAALYSDPHEAENKRILKALGWRVNTTARYRQAIRDFQAAWNLGPALTVDGDPGPKTRAALALSDKRRKAGKGDISEHFSAREFACACGGKWSACRRIWIRRSTVALAEQWRALTGPYTPARACRCPNQNSAVGGAKSSMHLHGLALDVPVYRVSAAQARRLGSVSGIGLYKSSAGEVVRHVDQRHLAPSNPGGGTVKNPAQWNYGTWSKTVPNPRPIT